MGHGLDVGRLLQPVVCLLLIVESRFNVEAIAFDNAILRARNTCSFRIVVDLEDPKSSCFQCLVPCYRLK